ncbi:tyrosine-type recombinase/integrase [Amnibacterium sp.]|uniref:tyrosine-type recombinase/integrase n=1 Tax=Amnibacterium sp. TaxID=1872496 RepID=UPI00260D9D43|nr:tyrosine-type recombinase/integrase [Amnibacterium sp.]
MLWPKGALELAWRRARAAAGVDERPTFHGLRAMYLTAYTAAGAPMPLVMACGGHSSVKAAMEYQRNLSDLSSDEKKAMIARLVSKKDRKEFGRWCTRGAQAPETTNGLIGFLWREKFLIRPFVLWI